MEAEIGALGEEFARVARPVVESALRRRLEVLFENQRDWFGALSPETARALRDAADRAIVQGTAGVERRLKERELWLDPVTAPGMNVSAERPGGRMPPGWISVLLPRWFRRALAPDLGELDDPGHRVWVALLSSATPLDLVLGEFGLAGSDFPDLGGGHFGLQPKTATQLDPTGTLQRLWKRYRVLYEQYSAPSRNTGA